MKLKELQHNFIKYMQGNEFDDNFIGEVTSDCVSDSLKIYQNNIFFSLLGSLENQYRALKQYLGEKKFISLAKACIDSNPSRSGNLDDYSKIFLEFMQSHIDDKTSTDIAKLDHNYWSIFISEDDVVTPRNEFVSIKASDYAKTKLCLSHSIRLLKLYDAQSLNIWNKLFYDKEITSGIQTEFIVGNRPNLFPKFEYIAESEYIFLKEIKAKRNLSDIFSGMLKRKEEGYFSVYITKNINKEIITSFTIN